MDELRDIMEQIGGLMYDSVIDNFTQGGRPEVWPALRSGGASFLQRSGTLLGSINQASGEDWAEVGTSLVYAAIHNFGGPINWPGTDNGFGRGISIPAHLIEMPKREFMMFQPEEPDRYVELFGDKFVGALVLTLADETTFTVSL